MTIINRALHKAYKRRAESDPAFEPKRQASATVSGWAAKLRKPIRPVERPIPEQQTVSEEPAPELVVAEPTIPKEESSEQEPGPTIRIDAGHSPTDSTPTDSTPAESLPESVPAAALRPDEQPLAAEQWSWPPIVQRLLTCPAAPELLDLATQVRALAAGQDLRCVVFSGPGRGVGRTSLVLTLASVLIADKTTSVAIVDADFSHPEAARMISLHPGTGLEEAINDPSAADEAVTTLLAGRLAIIPLVKPIPVEAINPRQIGTLQTFLRSLRREYDIVLIDAGPWEPEHGLLLLECRAVDAVVCVCRAKTADEDAAPATDFRNPGVEWLGTIETFARSGRDDNV